MSDEAARARRPKWDAVLLVCKDCGKRKQAPKDAKPKKLASLLRSLTKREPSRPRIALTSCLGLCPEKATAVSVVGASLVSSLVAIERLDQVAPWADSVFAPVRPLPGTPPSDVR